MRTAVVLLIAAGLGAAFLAQKHHEQKAGTQAATEQPDSSPRKASEHNWAKHSLDATGKVTRQVAQQRKEDGTR